MAEASAAGAVIGQKFWNGGWVPVDGYHSNFAYAGTNVNRWYPYILKFTIPEFEGFPVKLDITLYVGQGAGESPTLRWALCDSDEFMERYRDTNGEVEDPTQLDHGTVTMANVSTNHYQTVTVRASGLKSGGTYYLYLWGHADPEDAQWIEVYLATSHSVILYSTSGSAILVSGGVKRSATTVVKRNGKLYLCTLGAIQNGKFSAG